MYCSARLVWDTTIRNMIADYEKSWRAYEKQRAYEQAIVCSVPVREIGLEQNIVPTTDRWKPG